jgi:two-component system chemotaxis response regulator CheB
MPARDIIVVGGSAGSLAALDVFVQGLSPRLPAAVFVVVHISPDAPGMLPDILKRSTSLPVEFARDRQRIEPGRILVAPPDRHLVLSDGHVEVTRGPRENRFRPAIDPLFRSAAAAYGPRVVGIILSGMLDDGTHGLWAVKKQGGIAIVQDVQEATYASMPMSALDRVDVDHVLPVIQMPALLSRLAGEDGRRRSRTSFSAAARTNGRRSRKRAAPVAPIENGVPAVVACPDCGGTLWERDDDDVLRFRCRVGHAYAAQSLLAAQDERLEDAMWTALRILEEGAAVRHRMAERVASRGLTEISRGYEASAREAEEQAQTIRKILDRGVARAADVEAVAASERSSSERRKRIGRRSRNGDRATR